MKKLNIDDEELKVLLKSTAIEQPSSNFTSKLMIKVHEAAEKKAEIRIGYTSQLARKVAVILSGTFVVHLVLMINAFVQGAFNEFYEKLLLSPLANLYIVKLISSPVALAGTLSLALAVWLLIYMERNAYKSAN
jgi:hypothetical protein